MSNGRANRCLGVMVALVSQACGPPPPPVADAGDTDTGPPARSYLLGSRAEGYRIGESTKRVFDLAAVEILMEPEVIEGEEGDAGDAGDAALVPRIPLEALVVPVDLLGVPWDSFDGPENQPTELPGPWLVAFTEMVEAAEATGLPLVVALSPLSTEWDTLAARPDPDAAILLLNPLWKPYCHDPATDGDPLRYRDAYAGYATWVAREVEPQWLVLGQRMNRYEENCGKGAYDSLVGFTTEAHARVAALEAPPVTIVSVDVEDLYGYPSKEGRCVLSTPGECLAERATLLDEIVADRLGLESYPGWALASGQQWSTDWLDGVADVRPDLPTVITGTGLPSRDVFSKQGTCVPLLESSEQDQLIWLDRVLATAGAREMDLVVWTWLRDPVDGAAVAECSCNQPPELCSHLNDLGPAADLFRVRATSGLWGADGSPRQAVNLWTQLVMP